MPREPSTPALRWVRCAARGRTDPPGRRPRRAGLPRAGSRRSQGPRDPLRALLGDEVVAEPARASFVLVPGRSMLPVSERVPMLRLGDRKGTLSRHFADVDTFAPVLEVPDGPVYAVVGVERGEEFCGVRPAEAAVTHRGPRPEHAHHRGGAGLPARRARGAGEEQVLPHRRLAGHRPAGAGAVDLRRRHRTWAGAGSTTTTPGWVWPRPRDGSQSLLPEVTRR